jgi:hypothetical protein
MEQLKQDPSRNNYKKPVTLVPETYGFDSKTYNPGQGGFTMSKPYKKSHIMPVDPKTTFKVASPAKNRYADIEIESLNSVMQTAKRKKTPTNPVRRAQFDKEREMVEKIE